MRLGPADRCLRIFEVLPWRFAWSRLAGLAIGYLLTYSQMIACAALNKFGGPVGLAQKRGIIKLSHCEAEERTFVGEHHCRKTRSTCQHFFGKGDKPFLHDLEFVRYQFGFPLAYRWVVIVVSHESPFQLSAYET